MTIEELIDDVPMQLILIGSAYKLKYGEIADYKARINYMTKEITFNPVYNEEIPSFLHESLYHLYDNYIGIDRTEQEIEEEAQRLYKQRGYRKLVRHILDNELKL